MELLMASNLALQRDNVELRFDDKSKTWQIKGLTKAFSRIDSYFTQREASLKRAVGFLEGAFGGGWKFGGAWLRWLFLGLIVLGGYAYLNANPGLWQGFGSWAATGLNSYYLLALVSFTLIIGLYVVVKFRRGRVRNG